MKYKLPLAVSMLLSATMTCTSALAWNYDSKADAELLVSAVNANRINVIEQLVQEGLDINQALIGDGTPLMIAIQNKNLTLANKLVAMGADINQPSPGDGNPLIVAVKTKNLKIVKSVHQHGAELDAIVEGDETPLINAVQTGDLDIVKYLVEQGADVNLAVKVRTISNGWETRSPLSKASTRAIESYLKEHGAMSE